MLNILIVDDSVLMRNNIKSYIEDLGHKVIGEAQNGTIAVEMCSTLKPDLITMDITMPDMDGITAISKIREFNTDVNIIVATSHGQEEVIMKSLQAGAKGYILKPINENNLNEAINNIYGSIKNNEEYLLDD
ncbi:MAG: two-component system chemotaxis response regulator CheY [Sulfurimonas sp.]|jgi:two-component system chemotaxis response regulator CheY|uniref:response regulator n=1 Tax=Sulfurimonas sp. TaxID=2022749 RepID=UPI0039E3649E